jgi:hypothetical protein
MSEATMISIFHLGNEILPMILFQFRIQGVEVINRKQIDLSLEEKKNQSANRNSCYSATDSEVNNLDKIVVLC